MAGQQQTGAKSEQADVAEADPRMLRLNLRKARLEVLAQVTALILKWLLLAALLMILFGIAALVVSARSSNGVAIERLEVEPGIASPDANGEAIAARGLHRLALMRASTSTTRVVDVLDRDWLDDYRVEVPQTGVAIGDFHKGLRRLIGHDIYVRGDVHRKGDEYEVALWSPGHLVTRSFTDPEKLTETVAEALYELAYPYLFATYLSNFESRRGDSSRAYEALSNSSAPPIERAWALNGLALNLMDFEGRCADSIALLERAKRLMPDLPNVSGSLSNAYFCLGQDQQADDANREELRLLRKADDLIQPDRIRSLMLEDQANEAGQRADYRRRSEIFREYEQAGFGSRILARAHDQALLHDLKTSLRALGSARARASADDDRSGYCQARYVQLAMQGYWSDAARALDCVIAERRDPRRAAEAKTQWVPLKAIALARAGQQAAATRLALGFPADCYPCARSRAIIAETGGDRAAADHWFEEATRLGPRLPFAFVEWGQTRFDRSELSEARKLFKIATRLAPRWAAPFKGWADTLLAAGDPAGAAEKYAEAAKRAPKWGSLYIEWGKALWHSGRLPEAREKFHQAAVIGLSTRDLARARRLYRESGRRLRQGG